jgi:hypothetical protein
MNDVIVPKSQYKVPARFEIGGALLIVIRALSMLPAIQLDDQTCSFAAEVDDV